MKSVFTRYPKLSALSIGAVAMVILSAAYSRNHKPMQYHSQDEMVQMMMSITGLPVQDNGYFTGSGKCAGCHGIDPVGNANMTSEGVHVSPTEDWRATMMANSAKDPLWRAKLEHEITVNPSHEQELINKCAGCHSPAGKYTHVLQGEVNFPYIELDTDSIARDGVNCGACHQQRMEGLGQFFSGELHFHTDTIWGPYVSEEMSFPIFEAAMQSFVGYTPVGNHLTTKSEYCAACHTLETQTADLDGNLTGGNFIEQATYHEWLNSSYNSTGSLEKQCQSCHMPTLEEEPIVIASGYAFLPGREPFAQHWFVGGNSFMLGILRDNAEELGATATTDNFNMVIDRTIHQLQNQTATLEILPGEIDGDTARYTVRVTNLAGHKLPSGYPARRAYVEFEMLDADGNTIFHSGKPAEENQYEVYGNDLPYEPHHEIIKYEDQVQIYEMVMADVNGNTTTVLERAATTIKDNRLVPLGFSTLHSAYDTTMVIGSAATDINFNHIGSAEGTGTDDIQYHIPVTGIDGNITVRAKIMYQSVPPRWLEEMFATDGEHIDLFEEMYWQAGPMAVEMASDEASSTLVGVPNLKANGFNIWPNPSEGQINLNAGKGLIKDVSIYDIRGKLVESRKVNQSMIRMNLPIAKGTYIVVVTTDKGQFVEKVIRR
ncbi:MAG: T9SS type A sorting domain-containing protein [Flavobacteriales bacterium]